MNIKRIISYLLIFTLVFSVLPINTAIADDSGNIAKTATITTDSNPEQIQFMTDGIKNSNDSRWNSEWSKTHWIELAWKDSQNITNVKLWSGNMNAPGWQINDFELLYWDGSKWVSIQTITGNDKDGRDGEYNNLVFDTVKTSKIRLNITDGCAIPDDIIARVLELEVYTDVGTDLSTIKTTANISVDTSVTYQTIEGWGGNIYPHWITRLAENDPTYMSKLFEELNTTDVRIRSYWYTLEGENDNDDPNSFNWAAYEAGDKGDVHYEFLGLQALMKAGKKLHFSSWRFPNFLLGKPADYEQSGQVELTEDMEEEYIESLVGYFLYAFNKYGIKYDFVSVVNEPNTGVYITGITPQRYSKLTHKLKIKLEENSYFTKYYATEVADAGEGSSKWTNTAFYDDENGAFDALTYHSYRRTEEGLKAFAQLGQRFNASVYVTEFEDLPTGGPDRRIWSSAMRNAMAMYDVLTYSRANMVLYFCYSSVYAKSGGGGLVLYDTADKKLFPPYDMLKQIYNGIPIGSVMVESNVASDTAKEVYSMAFRKPDGKLELVLINNSSAYVKANINAGNRTFFVIKSNEDDRMLKDGSVESTSAKQAEYLLPPNSIVSFTQTNEVSLQEIINEFPSDGKIRVLVDKNLLSTDQDPVIVNDRTLVPLRAIFEALGADVQWDGATSTVTAQKDGKVVVVKIGDVNAMVNGEPKALDVPATIINSRTLVPIRFVSESLGATVDWNGDKKAVIISTNN